MSEKRSSALLLYDILQSIEKIEDFTRDLSFDQLMGDEKTKDAILRNLQVIGDASKTLPETLISKHHEVDWSGITGLRDIIIHRYFRVDWNLLWKSIQEELPVLKVQVQQLMKEKQF